MGLGLGSEARVRGTGTLHGARVRVRGTGTLHGATCSAVVAFVTSPDRARLAFNMVSVPLFFKGQGHSWPRCMTVDGFIYKYPNRVH